MTLGCFLLEIFNSGLKSKGEGVYVCVYGGGGGGEGVLFAF